MGLFGLFGGKEPKEKKEFWKAFKTAYSSLKEKNLQAMLSALEAYPSAWQGYLLAGLYYDFGFGKMPVDEAKAKEYQMKAEAAAMGTDAEGWVASFYEWYHQDAPNFRKKISKQELKVRQLGITALNMYEHGNPVICENKSDDADFWLQMFPIKDQEYAPFFDLFMAWSTYDIDERNNYVKNTNSLIKNADKSIKLGNKGDVDNLRFLDMYVYLVAFSLLNPSPYTIAEDWENAQMKSASTMGVERLIDAINMGCTPAVHHLVRLAYASKENFAFIEEICQKKCDNDLELQLVEWINYCMDADDDEAGRLYDLYLRME